MTNEAGDDLPDPTASLPQGELGQRIHHLRTALGLTQRELAAPKYTAAYVSSVESGRRTPSGDALAHFASRLGVSLAELRTGQTPDDPLRLDLRLAMAETLSGCAARTAFADLADTLTDPVRQARMLTGLGQIARHAGEFDAAQHHYEQADRLLSDQPAYQRVDALAGLAVCLRQRGEYRYAAYLLTSLRDELIRAECPDPGAMLVLNAHLAVCHTELDDAEQAASSATAALDLAGLADPGQVARAHLTVARTLLGAGDPTGAAVALEQARQASRQAALGGELGWCRLARARANRAAGELTTTVADLSLAHAIFIARDMPEPALDVAIELAEVYRELGQAARAAHLLDEAADASAPSGSSAVRLARIERVRGLLANDAGDIAAALAHLRVAFAGHRVAGPRRELARVTLLLADLLDAAGRGDDAAALLRDGLSSVERITTPAGRNPVVSGPAPPG